MAKTTRSKIMQRQAMAQELRRGIRAAQVRVALDQQRGRVTPPAVVRIANRKFPEVIVVERPAVTKPQQMAAGQL